MDAWTGSCLPEVGYSLVEESGNKSQGMYVYVCVFLIKCNGLGEANYIPEIPADIRIRFFDKLRVNILFFL